LTSRNKIRGEKRASPNRLFHSRPSPPLEKKKPLPAVQSVAQTKYGPVEGFRLVLKGRKGAAPDSYNIFLGIPYAKPPVGELRFQRPQPPTPWVDSPLPRPAKRYGPRAVQKDFWWDQWDLRVRKSEDCLYLNIITPSDSLRQPSPNHAVMVYIHGGGYVMDSAVKYHYRCLARSLVRHGVILVTIQYRLGYLGYWCTGDGVCEGNFGLWDQMAALQWVRDNISGFGGDPTNVTLFGQSAGAASADLMALSPLSRGLFDKLILMGGSAEAIWAVSAKHHVVEYCRRKAVKLGFQCQGEWNEEESRRLMEYLRGIPAEKFEKTMLGDRVIIDEMRIPLTPVIGDALLPRSLKELRAESPVRRVMAGVCEHEGLLFLAVGMQRKVDVTFLGYCERRAEEMLMKTYREKGDETAGTSLEAFRKMYGIDADTWLDKRQVAIKSVEVGF